jgi:hypothetical protein
MRSVLLIGLLAPCPALAQAYFQQQVDYTIRVRLDDERHLLHAHESFAYRNNSPRPLDTLWIHLWPNAYKDRGTALCAQLDRQGDLGLHFAQEADRGWIDSLDFAVDGAKAAWGYHPRHIDIAWLKLPAPVQPGASVTVTTPFRVKIPDSRFSRLGHTGQAYHITQWYPKPAVFDASGWHAMPYLTQGEFYSEFGSFDVSITLPANYVVGATGALQDEAERGFLDALALQPIAAQGQGSNAFPASAEASKTIRYTQDRVHDFAWFADKRFIVRKGSVTLPRSGRTVTTWAMFTPKNAPLWSDAITYLNESVRLYSQWVGDYPYDACTAVDGTISAGGGMEYPMITIIGNTGDKESLDNVIAHEVGHNWFYGILGSNERDHAWMDEGMNSFVELRYMRARYPGGGFNLPVPFLRKLAEGITDGHRLQNELGYRLNARRNLDQPLTLSSNDFTGTNYGTGVYMKTALIMDHLMAYLGEELMDRCMLAYFEDWKFKHPRPEDMRAVFERESGKDLGWVFDGLIGTDRKLSVKARGLRGNEFRYSVRGGILAPFPVEASAKHGDASATAWVEPKAKRGTAPLPAGEWASARIDAGARTLDIDRRDNNVRGHGLFRRASPLKAGPFIGLERDDRRSLHYTLLPAWNGHDGLQAGLALHNMGFPSQRTEWIVAPLYALGSERLVGAARIEHHFDRLRSRIFQNIHIGLSGRTSGTFHDRDAVAWYEKVAPSVRLDLKRDPLTRPWAHAVGLRGVRIWSASEATRDGAVVFRYRAAQDYAELWHRMHDARKLHPASVRTTLTAGEDWLRGSIEAEQAFAYNARNKQLRLRAFGGSFLRKSSGIAALEAWRLNWGPADMLYDQAYLERGAYDTDFTGRQFSKQQGAFKTPFLQGGSDTWIASAGMELDLPFKLPLAVFATAGWVPMTTITQEGKRNSTAAYAEAGVGIPIVRDVLEVWMPVYVSKRIADEEENRGRGFGDRIRFVLALEKLDPTRIVRGIRP